MGIPKWLSKAAEEAEPKKPSFTNEIWEKILSLSDGGKLDDSLTEFVEEMKSLKDLMDTALGKLTEQAAITKQAKAPELPKSKEEPEHLKLTPEEERINKLINEVPPSAPKETNPSGRKKLAPRLKEPETTKWKEIRFNKRTGTWQVVVTIRHTRNFMSENDAIDFTKKAELEKSIDKTSINVTQVKALLSGMSRHIQQYNEMLGTRAKQKGELNNEELERHVKWLTEQKAILDSILQEPVTLKKEADKGN
jgi:hypothetical protein